MHEICVPCWDNAEGCAQLSIFQDFVPDIFASRGVEEELAELIFLAGHEGCSYAVTRWDDGVDEALLEGGDVGHCDVEANDVDLDAQY